MTTIPAILPKDEAAAEGKVNVQINGTWYRFAAGTRIADACNSVGAHVPCFCYHPKLAVAGSCRMCLVEQGMPPRLAPGAAPSYDAQGYQSLQWMPRAIIACANTVSENMGIRTTGALTDDARRGVLEFLLSNHPLDCPICDQAGECTLQEYTTDYGPGVSRFTESKTKKGKNLSVGPRVNLDQERCVLCRRCVRFMRDIAGEEVLGVVGRGSHNAIACYPGTELTSNYSMNVVDICPVGAMTSKDFRFKMRVWFLKSTPSLDVNCGTGTNINIWSREQQLYRLTPRQNDDVNSCWMADDHRLNYKFVNAEERILNPLVRTDIGAPHRESTWEATLKMVAGQLKNCEGNKTAIVASARMTNEELYLVRALAKELGVTEIVTVARKGEDDGMLISADRNPNTTGKNLIIGEQESSIDAVKSGIASGRITAVLALQEDLCAEAGFTADELKKLDYLLCLTHSQNATTGLADVVLPGVTFAEKFGSMINVTGRIQRLNQAIQPIGQSRDDWSILRDLLVELGCECEKLASIKSSRELVAMMAEEFEPMQGLTWGKIGNQGQQIIETGVTIPLIEREKANN